MEPRWEVVCGCGERGGYCGFREVGEGVVGGLGDFGMQKMNEMEGQRSGVVDLKVDFSR